MFVNQVVSETRPKLTKIQQTVTKMERCLLDCSPESVLRWTIVLYSGTIF